MMPSLRIRSFKTSLSLGLSHLAVTGQLLINGQQAAVTATVIKPSITKIHLQPLHPFDELMPATPYANKPPNAFDVALPTCSMLTRHCSS